MNVLFVAGWLAAASMAAPDTTVPLGRGDRVLIEANAGSVVVLAWDRSELSVSGDRASHTAVVRRGERLVVAAREGRTRGRPVDLEVRVPAWAALEVRGNDLDVRVRGVAADVRIQTVEGDVRAEDVAGVVHLGTVEGRVEIDGARGRILARSRGGDVVARGVAGELEAGTGSGDVILEGITAAVVRAETLDGDLRYQGLLARGGRYRFSVHDGDAEIVVPRGSGVRARVATFDGEFSSDFPVTLEGYGGGGMFEFVLGDGGASLEIQVFDGEIRLRSGGP